MAPLIVIVGETASGKTAAAVKLAKAINGEIICADSRTVYEGMDIGTAKPTKEEQEGIAHHLLDVVTPDKPFTVADFKYLANEAIDDISSRGKIPIMVGGSGLYVDSLIFNYQFSEPGAERDPNNPRHLKKSGTSKPKVMRPNTLVYGLTIDRGVLKERITNRVEAMVARGLVEEVKELGKNYGWDAPALQAPGYKAFREYLNGTLSLEEAKALFVRNDLQLAKRQRTWFKRNKRIHWLDYRSNIVDIATTELNKLA